MTNEELIPCDLKDVTVTLADGSQYTGTFDVTPEVGLYHVMPKPSRAGVIERFAVVDLKALFVLLFVSAAMATEASAQTLPLDSYVAHVSIIDNCKADGGEVPRVTVADHLEPPQARTHVLTPDKIVHANDTWRFTLTLAKRHQFVWFNTKKCGTRISSLAVLPGVREYAGVLMPGGGPGSFEERDAYVAGVLPFAGVASVEMLPLDTDVRVVDYAEIVGRAFYFENAPYGTFRLRIQFQDFGVMLPPVTTYNPQDRLGPFHLILNVTDSDIRHALDLAYPPRLND